MKKGGKYIDRNISRVIRVAGFSAPLILVLYGAYLKFYAPDMIYGDSPFFFSATLIAWSLLAFLHLMLDSRNRYHVAWLLVLYHVLIIPYNLFVVGFLSPFLSGWLLLFFISYIYFGVRGLKLSLSAIAIAAIFDMTQAHYTAPEIITILFALCGLLAVAMALLEFTRIQEVDWKVFMQSKQEGVLQRERTTAIINNLADAVISTDGKGRIQVYNAATLSLFDTNRTLTGICIDDLIKVYDTRKKRVMLAHGLERSKTTVVRDDLTLETDEQPIRIELTRTPIRTSFGARSNTSHVMILRDITRTKSLEEEKDEFISVVSHELRTPLTIAEGTMSNIELMLGRDDIPLAKMSEQMDTAHEQIIFLSKMVNDLSTLSRAERGLSDAPERIDVKELLTELYNEYAPRAARNHLQLNLDITTRLGTIYTSRLYLTELVQNFLTNAIKYTKKGSITLQAKTHGDNLSIAVIDTGIGISKSDQKHIFEKFYRSEDYRTRETRGTGLGLYVSSKLAAKLGTTIEVSSRLNHGTTFSFSLTRSHDEK